MPSMAGERAIDRRTDVFVWNTNENTRRVEVQKLTRLFGIPFGKHIFIEHIRVLLGAGNGFEMFIDQSDLASHSINAFSEIGPDGPHIKNRQKHWLIQGNSDVAVTVTVPIFRHVFDSITFFQAAQDGFTPEFTWTFEPGPMNWTRTWAALFRQRRNIPKQTTVGRKFHQVGNYHVLRRYNLL